MHIILLFSTFSIFFILLCTTHGHTGRIGSNIVLHLSFSRESLFERKLIIPELDFCLDLDTDPFHPSQQYQLKKNTIFFLLVTEGERRSKTFVSIRLFKKKIRVQFPPLNVIHHQNLLTAKSRVLPRFSVISSPYTLLPNQSPYGFRHLKELGDIRIFFLLFFYWLLIDRRI